MAPRWLLQGSQLRFEMSLITLLPGWKTETVTSTTSWREVKIVKKGMQILGNFFFFLK